MQNAKTNKEIKKDLKENLIRKVSELMKKHNYNQSAVVNGTSIEQSQLSKLLNPNSNACPTQVDLIRLAEFFDVPIDYLVKPDYELNSSSIDYKSLTYKDIFRVLIQFHLNYQLEFIQGYHTYELELFPDDKYGVALIDDGYMQKKFAEWLTISAPFRNEYHEYNKEILDYVIKGFISTLDDTPIYREIPPLE